MQGSFDSQGFPMNIGIIEKLLCVFATLRLTTINHEKSNQPTISG
jgi:hypothetical protein